jgi:hypothetical protein
MNTAATALPTARTEQSVVTATADAALVIELFDQWTGPVEAQGAAFLCYYTRADLAA